MTIAQGIRKQTVAKKQSALGSVATGSGGQIVRRRTSVFDLPKNSFESDEIVSHQQSTGVAFGAAASTGKLDALISPGTYALFWATSVRKDFAAGATTGTLTNVTATLAGPQFVRAAGSFLTDGLKQFDVVRWTGWTAGSGANNARNFLITLLTATQMTGIFLDGTAVTAEAAGSSVTCTVYGKKAVAPTTGHTNDYFTFEEQYIDIADYELYQDIKLGQAAVNVPANGNCGVVFDFMGTGSRVSNGSAQLTTPTAETTAGVTSSVFGKVVVNGTVVANVSGLQFTIMENAAAVGPVVGSATMPDVSVGRIKVTGQFQSYVNATTLKTLYDAGSVTSIVVIVAVDGTATSDFVAYSLTAIKLTGDAPDDGEKAITRTFPFTAQINAAGGTSLAQDKTILSIQDSLAP